MPARPTIDLIAAAIFGTAVLHTFAAKLFDRLTNRYPSHAGLFHLAGEVEVVFGFWAIVLVLVMASVAGGGAALGYAESRNYTEPLFVFVVMVVAASRPVLQTGSCPCPRRWPRPGGPDRGAAVRVPVHRARRNDLGGADARAPGV